MSRSKEPTIEEYAEVIEEAKACQRLLGDRDVRFTGDTTEREAIEAAKKKNRSKNEEVY